MAAFINIDGLRINIDSILGYDSSEGTTYISRARDTIRTGTVTSEQLDEMICRATANVCGVVKAN